MSNRRVGWIVGNRADAHLAQPVLRRLCVTPGIACSVITVGALTDADRAGLPSAIRLSVAPPAGDAPAQIGRAMADILASTSALYATLALDLLVVVGDRWETCAAALAAVPFGTPILHLHGGEVTVGAVDQVYRQALTQMAHLHGAATADAAARIVGMGIPEWRVEVTGAPGLDQQHAPNGWTRDTLWANLGLPVDAEAPVLLTMHPATCDPVPPIQQLEGLLTVLLDDVRRPVVVTGVNPDPGGQAMAHRLAAWVAGQRRAVYVPSLGAVRYWALMRHAAVMVGNSSSGLIEAPAIPLPVVNLGSRQAGRVRARNVIDVGYDAPSIRDGMALALSPTFRASLAGLVNPYGDGHTSARIVDWIRTVALDWRLKRLAA